MTRAEDNTSTAKKMVFKAYAQKKIIHFTSCCRINATLDFVGPLNSIQTCSEYPDAVHSC